jgi:hypothetical protein
MEMFSITALVLEKTPLSLPFSGVSHTNTGYQQAILLDYTGK